MGLTGLDKHVIIQTDSNSKEEEPLNSRIMRIILCVISVYEKIN